MTRAEAQTEALRKWPLTGHIFDRDTDGAVKRRGTSPRYWVGSSATGTVFPHIYGNGDSWEAAFADAEGKTLEEYWQPKLSPKEAYDKLARIGAYLQNGNRLFIAAKAPIPRNIDVLHKAQEIIRLEMQMRGEDDSVL